MRPRVCVRARARLYAMSECYPECFDVLSKLLSRLEQRCPFPRCDWNILTNDRHERGKKPPLSAQGTQPLLRSAAHVWRLLSFAPATVLTGEFWPLSLFTFRFSVDLFHFCSQSTCGQPHYATGQLYDTSPAKPWQTVTEVLSLSPAFLAFWHPPVQTAVARLIGYVTATGPPAYVRATAHRRCQRCPEGLGTD